MSARSTPRVSIVIPAYNAALTVHETLTSLLTQTHHDWEAIVVDDGSTDGTSERAIQAVKQDSRVRVIAQANGGESAARNTGVAACHFDWLLFLDADDWIRSDYLEKVLAHLAANEGLDAVHCGYARVAADGTEVIEQYEPPVGDLFPTLARRAAFPIHACIVRKALVEDVGLFDVTLRTSPDWDLWQRIARTGAQFGAVREVLAFYRMSPRGASLDAHQLFRDGMRVLRQGVSADPRVKRPHHDHADGLRDQSVVSQEFYLLAWCAGLMLGSGQDAKSLLDLVGADSFPELYADAVAKCIFDAAPLPSCQPPRGWETLWPSLRLRIDDFLVALERRSQSPELARKAKDALRQMILEASPTWSLMAEAIGAIREQLEHDRRGWQLLAERWEQRYHEQAARLEAITSQHAAVESERRRFEDLAAEREQRLVEHQHQIEQLTETTRVLEVDRTTWQQTADARQSVILDHAARIEMLEREGLELQTRLSDRTHERDELARSPERQFGDFILNRLRLAKPIALMHAWAGRIAQRMSVARLFVERLLSRRPRIVATACDVFPIYSQTFVYQELTFLAAQNIDLRFVYSKLDERDLLQTSFASLWDTKRRLFLNPQTHQNDLAYYRRRMPEKVDRLMHLLSHASGMPRENVESHGNVQQAFSFTRMVEAYRPAYLHSYFFYDRSLMALVAGYLLGIPRGISCYADHLLQDYEFKLVPLHLELCDIVIATSSRIKDELLQLSPKADPSRILVKPNGIDTNRFPIMERTEPPDGEPYRLVSLCRIEPKKGLLDLVEAVSLLRESGLNVEAHIVGATDEWSQASRDYKTSLDQKITALDLWGKVHLEGRHNLEGIQRFLRISHLFVAPFVETESGDKDGIPTALLEGMSTGLPAVATNSGSIPEVISEGVNGLLIPQRSPSSLAAAVDTLLHNRERRAELGRAAAETVRRRFDVQVCERVFHERLRSVLATAPATTGQQ